MEAKKIAGKETRRIVKSNGVVKSKTGPKTRQHCQNVWQDANNRHPENQEER